MKSNQQYFSDDSYANNKLFTQMFDFNKSLSTVRYLILNAMKEYPEGIESKTLFSILVGQYNCLIYPAQFGCQNYEEFIEKYLGNELELQFNKDQQVWKVKVRITVDPVQKHIHYKFDTFPNANFTDKVPRTPENHSIMNSMDMSEENPHKQVTYQFVDQLEIPTSKFYGPIASGTVTPHRNISFWNISTRSSVDFSMINNGATITPSEERVDENIELEQDPEMKHIRTKIVEELFDEGDDNSSPSANIPNP